MMSFLTGYYKIGLVRGWKTGLLACLVSAAPCLPFLADYVTGWVRKLLYSYVQPQNGVESLDQIRARVMAARVSPVNLQSPMFGLLGKAEAVLSWFTTTGLALTGLVVKKGRYICDPTTDNRVASSLTTKLIEHKYEVIATDVLDVRSGLSTAVLYSPEIVAHAVDRVGLLSPVERDRECHVHCTRVKNLPIPTCMMEEVVRGSGRVALLRCSVTDLSQVIATGTLDLNGRWGGGQQYGALDIGLAMMLVCPLLLLGLQWLSATIIMGRRLRVVLSKYRLDPG